MRRVFVCDMVMLSDCGKDSQCLETLVYSPRMKSEEDAYYSTFESKKYVMESLFIFVSARAWKDGRVGIGVDGMECTLSFIPRNVC